MDRRAILADFLREVWSEGRSEAVDRYIAPRYTVHHDPGDAWEGMTLDRDGFRERLEKSRAAAPDQSFRPARMLADGDSVAVAWTWRGTHPGDLPGLPATGRPIRMSGLTIYDFDGALLTGHWQVADRLTVHRMIVAAEGKG